MDDPHSIGHAGPGSTAAATGARPFTRLVVVGAATLVVIAVILAVAAHTRKGPQSPEPSVQAHASVEPTSPGGPTSHRELFRLQSDTVAAVQRVVPGADLNLDEVTWFMLPARGVGLSLFVRVGGQSGGLRVHASRSRHEPCDGFSPSACRRQSGPHGAVVTIAHFDREVPPSQPRDTEMRATVHRPGGSWVEVGVDNAAAPSSPQSPAARTGRSPPLTEEQAIALASDPTLDFCAARSDGPCAPG